MEFKTNIKLVHTQTFLKLGVSKTNGYAEYGSHNSYFNNKYPNTVVINDAQITFITNFRKTNPDAYQCYEALIKAFPELNTSIQLPN